MLLVLRLALVLELLARARGVLVVVRRLRAVACTTVPPPSSLSAAAVCPQAPAGCETSDAPCAGLALLKVPRTGSTWLTKELRAFGAGVALEFEPFTDPNAHACQGRFYTLALGRALTNRLRCVTRESRSSPCYWGWLGCNATRLKPRASAAAAAATGGTIRPGGILTGFLLNPMYAPGAIWNRVLSLQPRARLVWLRRTNLVKMALSDIRRLAGASARHARSSHGSSTTGGAGGVSATAGAHHGAHDPSAAADDDPSAGFIDPRTLLVRLNMTLVTQATFPAAVALDRGWLVLYEDLQTHKLIVLRGLMRFLGLDHLPPVAAELAKQAAAERATGVSTGLTTHWQKASEDVCMLLPAGNCERLRAGLAGRPCLLSQLASTKPAAWSFPNHNGTLSLAELDGVCTELPPLEDVEPSTVTSVTSDTSVTSGGACPARAARRSLFDLYTTSMPAGATGHTTDTCPGGSAVPIKIAQSYVLPYSLSREALFSRSTTRTVGTASVDTGPSAASTISALAGGGKAGGGGAARPRRSQGGGAAVAAPHMVRPWQRMVAHQEGDSLYSPTTRGGVRFVIFSRQRSASTTFVGLLNLHPNVTSRWEAFSNSYTASKMRAFLGVDNRSAQLANIPNFMQVCNLHTPSSFHDLR